MPGSRFPCCLAAVHKSETEVRACNRFATRSCTVINTTNEKKFHPFDFVFDWRGLLHLTVLPAVPIIVCTSPPRRFNSPLQRRVALRGLHGWRQNIYLLPAV